jgi:hypothetical protein
MKKMDENKNETFKKFVQKMLVSIVIWQFCQCLSESRIRRAKYDVIKFALFWFEHLSMNLNARCPKIFKTYKFFWKKMKPVLCQLN